MQNRTYMIREKLILSGMELYARFGIEGVSLRAVNEHAGSKNNSAAHYHFKTKSNFIKQIITYMFEFEKDEITSFIDVYGNIFKGLELELFKFIAPLLFIYERQPWGKSGLQFLSVLIISDQSNKITFWTPQMIQNADEFIKQLAEYNPGVDQEELRLRASFMVVNLIVGLAAEKAIENTVFGNLSKIPEETQFLSLLSYCTRGLVGVSAVKSY